MAHRARRSAYYLVGGAMCIMASAQGRAQAVDGAVFDAAEANSVGARSKENYDPTGIPLGAFRLFASADARLSYDSNVFNIDTPRSADRTATVAPRAELTTRSPRYDLTLGANATVQRFDRLSTQNNTQYDLAASGGLRLGQSIALTADGFVGRRSELRGSIGDAIIGAPNQYDRAGGRVGVAVQFADLLLSAGGGVESLDYKPVRLGGTRISQDFRDSSIYSGTARAGLLVGPSLRAVVRGDYNVQRYRRSVDGVDRDSHGYAILGGIDFGLSALIGGELGVGYLSQTYDQGAVRTVNGLTYRAKIVWNPTTLLTATISGGRTLEQNPFFNQAGVLQDRVEVQLDYELLRNLIVSASGQTVFNKFRGLDRRDRYYAVDVSARLLISRTLEAGLRINHRTQSSSGTFSRQYAGTTASIGLIVKR